MKNTGVYAFVALLTLGLQMNNPAHAGWGKVTVTDGSGNGFEAHEYPFGLGKGMQMQDQLGDSYGYKKGLFGLNRSTKASILGNGMKIHHNFITGTSVEGESMFGDTVKSKKFLGLGPRITTVNLQGMHGVASGLLHHSATPSYDPNAYAGNTMNPTMGNAQYSQPLANSGGGAFSGAEHGGAFSGGPVDPNAYAPAPGSP